MSASDLAIDGNAGGGPDRLAGRENLFRYVAFSITEVASMASRFREPWVCEVWSANIHP